MALQSEVSSALSYAISKGFQIHPDAFAMLKGLDANVLQTVKEIIKSKKPSKNSVILVDDIKGLLSPKKDYGPIEQSCTVLMDPTPKVTTAEGVEGYASLFRSRFEKSMRILAQRPDSKRRTPNAISALTSPSISPKMGPPREPINTAAFRMMVYHARCDGRSWAGICSSI